MRRRRPPTRRSRRPAGRPSRPRRARSRPTSGFTGITDARFYINDAGDPGRDPRTRAPSRVAHTANESVAVDDLVAAAQDLRAGLRAVPRRLSLMQRFDVVVIGGGGTGSEVAFQLATALGRCGSRWPSATSSAASATTSGACRRR